MSQNEKHSDWYLGRDGKQFGPITEAEMRKLVELGHLRPADLLWRQGFAEWTPALQLFPPPTASPPGYAATPGSAQRNPSSAQLPRSAAPPNQRPPRDGPPTTHPVAPGVRHAPAPGAPNPGTGHFPANQPLHQNQPAQQTWARGPSPGNTAPPAPRQQWTPGQAPVGSQPFSQPRTGEHGMAPLAPLPPPPDPGSVGPDYSEAPRGHFPLKLAIAVLLLSLVGGGAIALYLKGLVPGLGNQVGSAVASKASQASHKASPLQGFAASADEVDAGFQKAALWQIVKREFPDWYKERVQETARLRTENKNDGDIATHLTLALVDLRRKNAAAALAASPERLRFVAASFVENLAGLAKHSTDACYAFISQGETSPVVVDLMRSSAHTAGLQTQFTAIFEAVAEGRKSPKKHDAPKRDDYDALAAQLASRGWSPIDLQVFSDARQLARAKPERVCQMVQDWFAAQLAVKDEATQMRLLVEALKPVVSG